MTDLQLRMAITGPPKKLGARVDDELVDALESRDLGGVDPESAG